MSEAPKSKAQAADEAPEEEKVKLNRREILNLAWLASLGFLVLEVGGVSYLFSYPRFREGEFGGIFNFGSPALLPVEGTAPENFPKVKLWISNSEKGVIALYKVCPHLGCLYSWSDQENKFICPCHGSQYEHDGTYISGPAPRSLDIFVIRIYDGDTLLVETGADGGPVVVPDNPNAVITIDTGKKILGETHA